MNYKGAFLPKENSATYCVAVACSPKHSTQFQ